MAEQTVEITIKFDHNMYSDGNSKLEVYVDGHQQDIDKMDEHIKLRCISELDKWYDKLYEGML